MAHQHRGGHRAHTAGHRGDGLHNGFCLIKTDIATELALFVDVDAHIHDDLTGPQMLAAGHEENLKRLQNELIHKDWFQTLPDFNAYVVRKGQALSDYACDPLGWRKKCVINIAKAGLFSSDRTIAEYNKDIWHLGE